MVGNRRELGFGLSNQQGCFCMQKHYLLSLRYSEDLPTLVSHEQSRWAHESIRKAKERHLSCQQQVPLSGCSTLLFFWYFPDGRQVSRIKIPLTSKFEVILTVHHDYYVEIKCQLDATADIYCRFYCMLNMFRAILCPSSGAREYYTDGRCLWYLMLWFSGCRYGVALKVTCPVCRLLL